MSKLVVTTFVFGIVLAARATPARADVGIGIFLGDPSGLDLKIGLTNRTGLDLVLGFNTFRDTHANYGHLTYLVTPVVAQGDAVLVPIRLGIGAALYGGSGDLDFAVRAPLEVALRLRNAPLEFYGELALAFTLFDPHEDALQADLQGGVGFCVFF
jgi:hypothetical protein